MYMDILMHAHMKDFPIQWGNKFALLMYAVCFTRRKATVVYEAKSCGAKWAPIKIFQLKYL